MAKKAVIKLKAMPFVLAMKQCTVFSEITTFKVDSKLDVQKYLVVFLLM